MLEEYKKKRDFSKTPEPSENKSQKLGQGLIYSIQEHHASHLHYDLRLEENGVLKSWAITKIPMNKQGIKRLAVQTEDHPLSYYNFEGEIPEGEYGAGTVHMWDLGTYILKEKKENLIKIEIKGKMLYGTFILVKLRSDPKNWLFFKS